MRSTYLWMREDGRCLGSSTVATLLSFLGLSLVLLPSCVDLTRPWEVARNAESGDALDANVAEDAAARDAVADAPNAKSNDTARIDSLCPCDADGVDVIAAGDGLHADDSYTIAGTGGTAGAGGATSGTGGAGSGGSPSMDTAIYNFEKGTQGWTYPASGLPFTLVAQSTTRHFAGKASLAGTLVALPGGKYQLEVQTDTLVSPGAIVTFNVLIPTGSTLNWLQAYVRDDGPSASTSTTKVQADSLVMGDWNTITVQSLTSGTSTTTIGVQFQFGAAWFGTVYIDSVTW
jgi:hypothetical protein